MSEIEQRVREFARDGGEFDDLPAIRELLRLYDEARANSQERENAAAILRALLARAEADLARVTEERSQLRALVGTIRAQFAIPVRNVTDIDCEAHSREIIGAVDTLRADLARVTAELSEAHERGARLAQWMEDAQHERDALSAKLARCEGLLRETRSYMLIDNPYSGPVMRELAARIDVALAEQEPRT